MMKMAIDTGFGRVKAQTESGQALNMPSLVAAFRPVRFSTGFESNGDPSSNLILERNGKTYFVGKSAQLQGVPQHTVDRERAVSEETELLVLAALGLLAGDNAHVELVAGLPVSHYASQKEEYSARLKQTHRFARVDSQGNRQEHYTVHIQGLKVIPQPLGTLFALLLDQYGQVQDGDLAKQNIGIIDIGYHTVDLARADNLTFIDRKSSSYPLGLHTIYSDVSESLNREHGIEAPPESLESVVSTGSIKIAGKEISIATEIDQACHQAADQITSKMKTLWPDRWQLDRIILTGGGANLLGNYLDLGEQGETAPRPVFANTDGYLRLAKRTWGDS